MCILCNNYGKKQAYLKRPDSVKQPKVSRYGLKTLLCIFWNSSGVLHDRGLEMNLMATSYAKYQKLTKVARNYFYKTSENCGPLRFEETVCMDTANQRKTTFLHLIVTLVTTHHIIPTRL